MKARLQRADRSLFVMLLSAIIGAAVPLLNVTARFAWRQSRSSGCPRTRTMLLKSGKPLTSSVQLQLITRSRAPVRTQARPNTYLATRSFQAARTCGRSCSKEDAGQECLLKDENQLDGLHGRRERDWCSGPQAAGMAVDSTGCGVVVAELGARSMR